MILQVGEFDMFSLRESVPSITPFLPSNQVPGPFRPVTVNKNQFQMYNGDIDQMIDVGQQQQYMQQQSNAIQAYRKLQKHYVSKPIKYTAYLNSNQQYIQLLPTTTESVIKSDDSAGFKQYYEFPKIYGPSVKSQEGYANYGSVDTSSVKTNVKFNENK